MHLPGIFPVHAQFEGVVVSKNLTTDEMGNVQEFTMTMLIGEDMARIQTRGAPEAPPSVMIYRNDLKVVWMLSGEDSSYFEINQEGPAQEIRPHAPDSGPQKYKVHMTGKKRKMLGYPVEQIVLSRGDERTEIWGTKRLPNLSRAISRAFGEEHSQLADGWNDEVQRLGFFLLSAVTTLGGRVVESQELTSIEQRELDDGLFVIPPGYRKQDAGSMFDGGPGE